MNRLVEIARVAERLDWMKKSWAKRGKLTSVRGYCCAWAAEILAHAFDPGLGSNARHQTRDFTYKYGSADEWGRALRAGVDDGLGAWIARYMTGPLRPGDMVFWLGGVGGYKWSSGHVAIVVAVSEKGSVTVSENSSSRGIGTHQISSAALSTAAGVMRWNIGQEKSLRVVLLPGNTVIECHPVIEGGVTRCDLRPLAEALGRTVHGQHVTTHGKIYLQLSGGD